MNGILMNVLITAILVGVLAAITYFVVKPVLRKRLLNNPEVVRHVVIDSESKALLFTVPFTWYCSEDDFTRYANFAKYADPKIDIIGHFTKYGTYGISCHWVFDERDMTKYDLTRMQGRYCRVAFRSCAIIEPGTSVEDIENLLKQARIG